MIVRRGFRGLGDGVPTQTVFYGVPTQTIPTETVLTGVPTQTPQPVPFGSTPAFQFANLTTGVVPQGQVPIYSQVSETSVIHDGDKWQASIIAAGPNMPVLVNRKYRMGDQMGGEMTVASETVAMGQTDGNGNLTVSGVLSTNSGQTVDEIWIVGGVPVGAVSYESAPPPFGGPIPEPLAQAAGLVYPPSGAIGGIPNWALGVGALVLILVVAR